jgi:L-ascorbate metabolism protein UlaG (beta-lactamase superfamily)
MEKLKDEKINVAFLPIGGTYTMDVDDAIEAAQSIRSELIIPVHYNFIDGTEADPKKFKDKVEEKKVSRVIILSAN